MLKLPMPGPRKDALCQLTPQCEVAAEIGADHGITSAHLIRKDICSKMIVSDISAASLDKARRLFEMHEMTDAAEFYVADGMDAINRPVDAIIIAGMGANTMVDILQAGIDRIGDAKLVLQTNTDLDILRRWLMEHDFCIEAEKLVRDSGRFYVVMRALRGKSIYTEKELLLGPRLLHERPLLWMDYLTWRHECLLKVKRENNEDAIMWIEEEMKCQ